MSGMCEEQTGFLVQLLSVCFYVAYVEVLHNQVRQDKE